MDAAVERYFAAVGQEFPEVDVGNLRFSLARLFADVSLQDCKVLDVGAGDGRHAFYAAAAGAAHVLALEPEAAGSTADAGNKFERLADLMPKQPVAVRSDTFQAYEPGGERFDVVLLHAAVNHLDEEACVALHRDARARDVYRGLFAKLAGMCADGAKVILLDCSRHNLFASLGVENPFAPTIEWHKHQPPRVWCELLSEAGFTDSTVRWTSFNTLRTPGRILLGNRFTAWFLRSSFQLTMTFRPALTPVSP